MWKTIKQTAWEWRGVAIAAPSVAGLVLLLRFAGLLQAWEWSAFDQYMRLRPAVQADDRIVIVGINEADVKEIGQAIIPDGTYAKLLEKLKAQKPRAIGLDIYRDQPVQPGHQQLVQIFNSTPNLVGIEKVVGERGREAVAPPPALKAKGQVGANDLIFDADNKVRRGLISVNDSSGGTVYSFGFYLSLLYLDAQGIQIKTTANPNDWTLGKATFPPFESNDGGYVRADDRGHQILLNYRGPARSFKTVSLMDVLKDRVPANWGRDRIIMVGAVSESFQDLVFTPHSSTLLSLPERMAGVEVHANLASQFISAAIDDRAPIATWSESTEWLWVLLWSSIGAGAAWQMRQAGNTRKSLLLRVLVPVSAAAFLLSSTYGLFIAGWWIPLVPPFLALTGSAAAITGYVAHSAGKIRKTFGRYLSDEIVANLLESPTGLSLGGERREITILTSDLRGFTATAERISPEEVIKVINFYFGHMADVINRYQGTIDEFMGDGILVLFGAPTKRADDAERAVACAIAMQLAMEEVNQTMQDWGHAALQMGIGINTGEVIVGNIGSEKRTKYGVIGSQVNLTYRIESYTTPGQVLISEPTLKEAGAIVKIDQEKEVKPKGVQNPIKIYDVGGIEGKHKLHLQKEEEVFVTLPKALPLQYMELSGKHVGEVGIQARLTELSVNGALLEPDQPVEVGLLTPLTNIKLNFLPWDDRPDLSEDVYAKVVDKPAQKGVYILFTAKPPIVTTQLATLYQSLKG